MSPPPNHSNPLPQFPKNIHEPQDMAHARKMKTISKDTIFMGKCS